MALEQKEIDFILDSQGLKKDTYRFIQYSDEIKRYMIAYKGVLNRTDLINVLRAFKNQKKLKQNATLNQFLRYFVDVLGIFTVISINNEYKDTIITRYIINGNPISPYEVALSLLSNSFLSHYSALYVNDLTLNIPKDIYINKEQSEKHNSNDNNQLSQGKVDFAFSKKMRRTKMTYTFKYNKIQYRVHVLNTKNTHNTGVVSKKFIGFSKPIRVTNLERTLIDVTVRPSYSGGTSEILNAFQTANKNIDINRLWNYLKKFNYMYPYYKSIAFYLKHSGIPYKKKYEELFEDNKDKHIKFYLDYLIVGKKFDTELEIYYPKSLENFF